MKLVKKEIEVGKETSEVAEAIKELVLDIRSGKELTLIAGENLPSLMRAVEGIDQVSDEIKSEARNATIAYSGLMIADALTEKVEKA